MLRYILIANIVSYLATPPILSMIFTSKARHLSFIGYMASQTVAECYTKFYVVGVYCVELFYHDVFI